MARRKKEVTGGRRSIYEGRCERSEKRKREERKGERVRKSKREENGKA